MPQRCREMRKEEQVSVKYQNERKEQKELKDFEKKENDRNK